MVHIKKKNARIKKLVERIDALRVREKDWSEQASAVISADEWVLLRLACMVDQDLAGMVCKGLQHAYWRVVASAG